MKKAQPNQELIGTQGTQYSGAEHLENLRQLRSDYYPSIESRGDFYTWFYYCPGKVVDLRIVLECGNFKIMKKAEIYFRI
ncbi:MAG: hypothetical protein H6581_06255 [Bacteroidia bacterium]|nr:hypothetical protein [Bacteroidia bacterium]